MAEMPIKMKLGRMSLRLSKYIYRDELQMLWGDTPEFLTQNNGMTLRSKTILAPTQWQGVDRRDFGDTIYMLSDIYSKNPDKDKFNSKKDKALKFNPTDVADWVQKKNKEISRIIAERKRGLRD